MNSLVASIGRLTLATVRPLPASLNSRHSLSTTSFKSSLFSPTTTTTPVAKTIQNGIICPSQSWASPSLLLGCVGMSSMLISQMQVRYRRVYITRSRRFPGHVDVYGEEDGKREALKAAEDRYKRLDWGIYIRTRVGKDNKRWKQTDRRKWRREQHIFVVQDFNKKLDRMFANETKRARFIPDDPFEKYNRLSWWRHHWTALKNAENIRRHGNNIYLFNRFRTHMKLGSRYNVLPKMHYMPPGYLANVASNPANIYTPDPLIPKVKMAPHFQREAIRPPRVKIDAELHAIRDMEQYAGDLPLWSPVFFPSKFPN